MLGKGTERGESIGEERVKPGGAYLSKSYTIFCGLE